MRFGSTELERLYTDSSFEAKYSRSIVRAYRKTLGWILAADDERDFYQLRGLHFERLQGRPGQHSMRLNQQFRLIVEFEATNPRTVVIWAIEDYH